MGDRINRGIPDLCEDKITCCGCAACYSVCPVQAIAMVPNKRGFLYPKINGEICIRCYKCIDNCAFKKRLETGK